jgi:NitT/TauT family transport system ATP-binding protein
VSLIIQEGQLVVFLGPSGCGKTTLLRIIGGLDSPTVGRVVLEDDTVEGPSRNKGMVFQSYSSFPWLTVFGNVRFGLKYRRDVGNSEKDEIARHYLALVGLEDFAHFYVNRISGGMRQRVAIARTLAASPDVLLMDEPFGALDAQTREALQVQLLDIRREERKTVVFVTHDVDEAIFLADRIIVFSARPARIIEEIDVHSRLPGEKTLDLLDSEGFFHLRRHVLSLVRAEARRTAETVKEH